MAVERGSLRRGETVWLVQIERYTGILEEPKVNHGKVVAAGDVYVAVGWHDGWLDREKRFSMEARVSRTEREAFLDAQARLQGIRSVAAARAYQVEQLLAKVADHIAVAS